jgi:co-chaperonin GroES (HSP10)
MKNALLKGKRILIEKPVRKESAVILGEDVQAGLDADMMKQWSRLKVVAVGDECTSVKVGDQVYIGSALANCEVVDIDGAVYFIAYESNVAIIWNEQEK